MRKLSLLSLITILLFGIATPACAAPAPPVRVYYAGPDDGVQRALGLAEDEGQFELVTDPAQADVLVLNGTLPDPGALGMDGHRLMNNIGLVLIPGAQVNAADLRAWLGDAATLTPRDGALSLSAAPGPSDPLLDEIVWSSAPQVRARAEIGGASLTPLVMGFEDGSMVLGTRQLGAGRVYVFTPYLGADNPQIQEWAYFNYLVYHLTLRAAGRVPVAFADYAGSPVPHEAERTALYLGLAGMLAVAVAIFALVRRYSRAHPELLDVLVSGTAEFTVREAGTGWEQIGFHRSLGGFLLSLMSGLVLFIPLIIYQNLILPTYILPSAQALGIWGRVVQFFNMLWLFFDMGTSMAFMKFFAQYRVHEPRRAIQYGQVYIWWQALSGAFQVALVTAVAGTLLPRTPYALYTWSIIVHTLIQIPGFYQVMRYALMSWQRTDYAQTLDLALYTVFPMVTQPILVTLLSAWGAAHPVFGASLGGVLGMGLAAYASELLTFLLGLGLYRRLGYNVRLLFLAHFDWAAVKQAFRFGVYEMLGSAAWGVGQSVEILITQTRLVNYAEVWGNWGLAQNFVFAFSVLAGLFDNLVPAISEAISHARLALSQYYTAMAYKWGALVSAFIGAVLLAVADRFILGASGPEFVRAAAYAGPLILWGAIQYPSWVADTVQRAANRTPLRFLLVALEQVMRIGLAFLLLERFQVNALIIAYFAGLFTKNIVAYFVNHRVCYPHRFYFWQCLGAPLLAGAAHYGVLRLVTGLIWQGDQITSILIFLIGILLSLPLFAFFYGLAGGWDDATLAEFGRAADLSGFVRPMSRLFYAGNALGARLSPLHGRFPIDTYAPAQREAESLTKERVELVAAGGQP